MQIENWKIKDLVPYAKNPRKNDHAVNTVAAAIKEFGFRVPVLIKFGGGGSTIIAAEKTGRTALLLELDEKFVDVIIKRWQEFSGCVAKLDKDGRTFAEIEKERSV